jgi:hypothetical protein
MADTTTKRDDAAAGVAVEELTGLALQERALTQLLERHRDEAPPEVRDRLERHVQQSRNHLAVFQREIARLGDHRGPAELAAGWLRSGLAALGEVGTAAAQVATAPIGLLHRGSMQEERLLENAGVEGAALANKLVILTAVAEAARLSGRDETAAALADVRDEASATWDELREQVPELMRGLVGARRAA